LLSSGPGGDFAQPVLRPSAGVRPHPVFDRPAHEPAVGLATSSERET